MLESSRIDKDCASREDEEIGVVATLTSACVHDILVDKTPELDGGRSRITAAPSHTIVRQRIVADVANDTGGSGGSEVLSHSHRMDSHGPVFSQTTRCKFALSSFAAFLPKLIRVW